MNQLNCAEFNFNIPGSILLIGSSNSLAKSRDSILQKYPTEAGDCLEISPDDSEGKSRVIAIKQIREAQHFINLTPHGQYKILLITGADRMTAQAANALLKTLEEPPKYALIVLSSISRNLLPTIISRCQNINLWNDEASCTLDYDFQQILQSAFYMQSQLAEDIALKQNAPDFLDQLELWARQKMRQEKKVIWTKLIRDIVEAKQNLKHNVNARIVLENLMLKYQIRPKSNLK